MLVDASGCRPKLVTTAMPKLTPGLNPIPLALHEVTPYCRHADLMSKQAQFKRLKIFSTSIQSKIMGISWTSWENQTKRNPHSSARNHSKTPQKMKKTNMEMTWEKYQHKTNKIPKNIHLWQPGGEGATRPERFMAFPYRWDLRGARAPQFCLPRK